MKNIHEPKTPAEEIAELEVRIKNLDELIIAKKTNQHTIDKLAEIRLHCWEELNVLRKSQGSEGLRRAA